jgi:hypothetical protein
MASRCPKFTPASLCVAAIEVRRAAIQSQELVRKNIRKSSAKPNDFVSRNRKLASNSFYVMGEIFLETLMATPAKAVLQPDPLPALTNDVNQLDERLNAKEQAICPFPT